MGVLLKGAECGKLFVYIKKIVQKIGDGANMVLNEKTTKNLKLRGLKLRRLRQNQISFPYNIYKNDQQEKIYTVRDFGRGTPTQFQHLGKIKILISQGIEPKY